MAVRARRDPLVLALVGAALVAVGWFAFDLGSEVAQTWATWLIFGLAHTVVAVSAYRAGRRTTARAARRLWLAIAFAGAAFLVGDVVQWVAMLVLDPSDPAFRTGVPVQAGLVLLGLTVALVAALAEPLRLGSGFARAQFWLELGIVLAGVTAVGSFVLPYLQGSPVEIAAQIAVELALFAVVAFVVLRLSSAATPAFSGAAGRLVALAAIGESLAGFFQQILVPAGIVHWFYLLCVVPNVLLALGARVHALDPRAASPTARPSQGTGGALIALIAAVATQVLLLATLATEGLTARSWIVVLTTVVGTGLVMVRQLVVMREKAQLLHDLDARVEELHATLADRDTLSRRLELLAFHDTLTGLPNRAALDERLPVELPKRSEEPGAPRLVVVFVDLDGFKAVNDAHGHTVGDALLVAAARRIVACTREDDLVVRLGGDEFCLLVVAPADQARTLAARVVSALGRPFHLDRVVVTIGASVGVAVCRADDVTGADVLRRADAAMYEAKRLGKGRYVLDDGTDQVDGRHSPAAPTQSTSPSTPVSA